MLQLKMAFILWGTREHIRNLEEFSNTKNRIKERPFKNI